MNSALRFALGTIAASILLLVLIAAGCQRQAIAAGLQMKSAPTPTCDAVNFPGTAPLIIFGLTNIALEGHVHLYEEEWILFRTFHDVPVAKGMCLWLQNEQIAARHESNHVLVLRSLEHRAEWVVDQLPPTEEELRNLAMPLVKDEMDSSLVETQS
jgi:hypothetical protein